MKKRNFVAKAMFKLGKASSRVHEKPYKAKRRKDKQDLMKGPWC